MKVKYRQVFFGKIGDKLSCKRLLYILTYNKYIYYKKTFLNKCIFGIKAFNLFILPWQKKLLEFKIHYNKV